MTNEIRDAFRLAWRKYATDGVPSSGKHEPDKADIVPIGGIIEEQLEAAVSGAVRAETWAALAAITGTRVGQPGEVPDQAGTHTDPVAGGTVANEGYYRWSASPAGWRWVAPYGDLVALQTQVDNIEEALGFTNDDVELLQGLNYGPIGFSAKIVFDPFGAYGQVRTIYLPRRYFLRRNGVNKDVANIGTASARLQFTTELTYTDPNLIKVVYLDLDDDVVPYKIADATSGFVATGGDLIPLFSMWNDRIYGCTHEVEYAEQTGQPFPYRPFVVDGTALLIPRVTWNTGEFSDTVAAPSGMFVKEIADFAALGASKVLTFNHFAFLRGEDPYEVHEGTKFPDNRYMSPLVWSYQGRVSGRVPLIGDVPGGMAINATPMRKDAPEFGAERIRTGTAPVGISDADALALGFTQGMANSIDGRPYYGTNFLRCRGGTWFFARLFVISDEDDNWPSVYCTIFRADGTQSPNQATLEKRYSARFASFVVSFKLGGAEYIGAYMGAEGGGRSIVICGLQIAPSNPNEQWVARADYALSEAGAYEYRLKLLLDQATILSEADPIYPDQMFLIDGRPLQFYPEQLIASQEVGKDYVVTLAGRNVDTGLPTVLSGGTQGFLIDGKRIKGDANIITRLRAGSQNVRKQKPVTVNVAAATVLSGKSMSVHCMGDSLTQRTGSVPAIRDKLIVLGATPTMIGTVNSNGPGYTDALGEGRGGMEAADYTYQNTDALSPLPVGDEAAYMAMTDTEKRTYSPYLRVATGGEAHPERVFNGYIFDAGFYFTRFSLAVPDYIVINLGTNDYVQQGVTSGHIQLGIALDIIVNSFREAAPAAKIALVGNVVVQSDGGETFWPTSVALNRQLIEFVIDLADADVVMLPMWPHVSREAGWDFPVTATDVALNLETISGIVDVYHFEGVATEQYAEVAVAWIACQE